MGRQKYYPYGETRWTTGTIYTDQLFTGQREMAGLGIYDYGARFYSPKLGRFLSADTIVPGVANPQALNRYSYVLGNPIRYNDPTGHMCSDPDDIWSPGCDGSGTPPPTTPLPTTPLPNPGSGDNDDDEDLEDELILNGGGGKPLYDITSCPFDDCTIKNSYTYSYEYLKELETDLLNLQSNLDKISLGLIIAGVVVGLFALNPALTGPALLLGSALAVSGAYIGFEANQLGSLNHFVGEMKGSAQASTSKSIVGLTFTLPNVNDSSLSLTYIDAKLAYTPDSLLTLIFVNQTLHVNKP